jgi:hypothetical protein
MCIYLLVYNNYHKTAVISLRNVNWFVFIMEMYFALCEVRTEVYIQFRLISLFILVRNQCASSRSYNRAFRNVFLVFLCIEANSEPKFQVITACCPCSLSVHINWNYFPCSAGQQIMFLSHTVNKNNGPDLDPRFVTSVTPSFFYLFLSEGRAAEAWKPNDSSPKSPGLPDEVKCLSFRPWLSLSSSSSSPLLLFHFFFFFFNDLTDQYWFLGFSSSCFETCNVLWG